MIGWQEALEYRMEFVLSLIGWFARLLISLFIWMAVFQGQQKVGNYDFQGIMVYFFLMQIVIALVYSRIGFQVGQDIHTGDFSQYLTKPISYGLYQIMYELSKNLFKSFIGAALFLSLLSFVFPSFFSSISFFQLPVIFLILMMAYLISAFLSLCIGYSGFWLTDANRLMYVYFALTTAVSGITAPLDLFPPTLAHVMYYLPFTYIFYFPVKVMQGGLSSDEIIRVLAFQFFFILFFFILSSILYRFGVKKYEAVGN